MCTRALLLASSLLLLRADLVSQCAPSWQANPLVPGVDGYAYSIANWDPDGAGPLPLLAVVGGRFTLAGGVSANSLASFDPATGFWWTIGGVNYWGSVDALLALPNGGLVAGGTFSISPVGPFGIARWDGLAWHPIGGSFVGSAASVRALALMPNGDLVAGGWFGLPNYAGSWNVARWDGVGWQPLGNLPPNPIRALAVLPNGDLAVGLDAGSFWPGYVAIWNGTSFQPPPSQPFRTVTALGVLPNGDLVAAGEHLVWTGPPTGNHVVAQWTGSAWTQLGVANRAIYALHVLPNGTLAAGGQFTAISGVAANGLALWNGSVWQQLGGGTPPSTYGAEGVLAIAQRSNGELVVSGQFNAFGGVATERLVRLDPTCPATATAIPTACIGPGGPLAATADVLPWLGSTCRMRATGFTAQAVGMTVLGLAPANTPLAAIHPAGWPGCFQLARLDAMAFLPVTAGAVQHSFFVPRQPVLTGLPVFAQFAQFELDGFGNITTLTSSNGLALVVGSF